MSRLLAVLIAALALFVTERASVAAGQPVNVFDSIYSFLTGHQPGHTLPLQLAGTTSNAAQQAATQVLQNIERRRGVNAEALRQNAEGLTAIAQNAKARTTDTYLGAGVKGALDALRGMLVPPSSLIGSLSSMAAVPASFGFPTAASAASSPSSPANLRAAVAQAAAPSPTVNGAPTLRIF